MNNLESKGVLAKITISILIGLLGFVLSPLGLEFSVEHININLPWSMLFPIMASMAYGWRYAIVASLLGGAIYPFLLWPTNGWPNLTTAICYSLFFIAVGVASHPQPGARLQNQTLRLLTAIILFAILLLGYYTFIFEAMLELNPLLWADNAITTINSHLLFTFFTKDIISFTLLTIAADTFLRAPIIRRFLHLKTEVSQRRNNYVVFATLFGALIIWASLLILSTFLIDDLKNKHGEVLLLALFIILASSFIIARILIYFTEKQQAFKADIVERETRAKLQRDAITELALNQLLTESDFSQAIQRVVEILSTTLGVARAGVWWFSDDCSELRCLSLFDTESKNHSSGLILAANQYPDYFQIFKTDNRINAEDAQSDPRTYELSESYLKEMGITSMLDVGIFNEGILAGVVCCEHMGPKRKWHDDEESFVSTVSAIVAQLFVNSKRKQAEEALRKSEEENRSIVEVLPDMLFKLAKDGKYIDIKTSSEEDLADPKKDLLNKTVQDVLPPAVSSSLIDAINKAIKTNKTQIIEYNLRVPAGKKVFEARIQRLNEDEVLAFVRNITEKYEFQRKLKESEENYRELFNNNLFPTMISDFEGRILFYNQYTVDYFGIDTNSLDEIRTKDYYANPEQRKEFVELLKRDGFVIKWEVDIKTGRGAKKTALVSTKIINYKGVKALQSVFSDITERKLAEEALRESERRFHDALEYIAVPVGITVEDKIIHHNRLFMETFGYTPEDVPTVDVWMSKAYPNDEYREFAQGQWLADVKDAIAGKTSTLPREYKITCKNGDVKLATLIGRQVGDVFVAVFQDITQQRAAEKALRNSEERYRKLFESANDAIFMISDGKITECNKNTYEMFGYREESIIGKTPWELSPPLQPDGNDSREKAMYFIGRVLLGETMVFDWLHLRGNCSKFEAEVSLTRLQLPGKDVLMAAVRDISEKVRLERDAQLNVFRGEENERARVAKELHDGIGPLLSTCKIYLHTMGLAKVDIGSNKDYNKLSQLLDDALASVREISNNLSPHLVKNFGLIHALKNYIEKVAFAGKINLLYNCDNNKRFDDTIETSLYRVITELVNNTLKYANAKTISIELKCKTDKLLQVKFEDDGVGFDLLEVMKNAKGHGLINIKARVKALDGSVYFQSNSGKGMIVTIIIKI